MLTGCNEAFVIDGATRQKLIDADARSGELIKPLAVGDDVRKWHVRDKARYLIFARRGTNIEQYPAVLAHLRQYRERLEPRPRDWMSGKPWPGRKPGSYKWFEIQDEVAYFREFAKPKIIYPDIVQSPRFAMDLTGVFSNDTTFILPQEDYFLLGLLNSRAAWTYLDTVSASIQGKSLRMKKIYVATIPVPILCEEERVRIADMARKCCSKTAVNVSHIEAEIDEAFNKAFGLS